MQNIFLDESLSITLLSYVLFCIMLIAIKSVHYLKLFFTAHSSESKHHE